MGLSVRPGPEGPPWTCSGGESPSHHRGRLTTPAPPPPTSAPFCAPRLLLGGGCVGSAPLPCLSAPPPGPGAPGGGGDFGGGRGGHRQPSTVSWREGRRTAYP